jgi:hypothetical protein
MDIYVIFVFCIEFFRKCHFVALRIKHDELLLPRTREDGELELEIGSRSNHPM